MNLPTGIKTNEIGKTTSHLNLTRTMADVWRSEQLTIKRMEKNRQRRRARREGHSSKASYAGASV